MQAAVYNLAHEAAAAGRTQPEALEAAARPVRKYRGVQARGKRFVAAVWWSEARKSAWLGSYGTPEEAAYAYDAGARTLHRRWAKPNFPEPPTMRGAAAALAAREAARNGNVQGAGGADAPGGSVVQAEPKRARVLPPALAPHARSAFFRWMPHAAVVHRAPAAPGVVLALPAPNQQRARVPLPLTALEQVKPNFPQRAQHVRRECVRLPERVR